MAKIKLQLDEQRRLRDLAKAECERLDAIQSDEVTAHLVENFKTKFSQCEIVYKTVLSEHQYRKNGSRPDRMKVDMRQVPYALMFAGYDFDKAFLDKIFGAKETIGARSVKKLRDSLTHSMPVDAIDELRLRQTELFDLMNQFLQKIRDFDAA